MQTSVGAIFSDTIAMVKARIGGLTGLWFTFFAFQIFLYIVFFGIMGTTFAAAGMAGDPNFAASMGAGAILLMFLFYAAYLYIYSAQSVSMGIMASRLEQPAFGDALARGFRGGLSMLAAYVLLFIAFFVGALVFGLLSAVLSALGDVGGLIAIVAMIGILVYLACRLLIIAVVVGVDRVRNPITAIARSWKMTGGNVLPILLSIIALAVFAVIVFLLPVVLFFGTIQGLEGASPDQIADAFGSLAIMGIVFLIISVVFAIVSSALISAVHANVSDTQSAALEETFG